MSLLNTVQFTCHTLEDGGKTAHFTVKRRKLEKYEQLGAKYIREFVQHLRLTDDEGAAAAMRSVRTIIDPETATKFGQMTDFAAKLRRTAAESPDFEADDADRINNTAAGTSIAALTIWYVMFRYRTNFFKIRPKLWQSIHVYYLEGNNTADSNWPLIKLKAVPYEFWKDKPEITLPELERINVWLA